jgi:hypothetical protein
MTDDERLEILGLAHDLGLYGMGGECGETAIAINRLLFGGRGQLVAAVNWPLWQRGRLIGHVGVEHRNVVWDAEGTYDDEEALEDFRAWGMLDPDEHPELTEDEAYDARIVRVSERQVRSALPACGSTDPWRAIRAAVQSVLHR